LLGEQMRIPGSLGFKVAAIGCACLLSAVSYAQESEVTTSGDQDSQVVAAALPDTPEPQNSNSGAQQQQPTTQPQQQGAQQPGAPSLGDLEFPAEQTKPNPQQQALLDKRSHMLKIHQRLGLITAVPLVATVVTGSMAGGHSTSSSTRDLHAALGSTTAGLYIATAYYSIFAPKIKGTPTRGPIRLHKALAFIHGPGMILTPILGAVAFQQKSNGEKVHGIASAHAAVAYTTAIAYGAAIASVSFKF
jgi:hypothetical protein